MQPVIFIFGASCSGKSSLAKALHTELGQKWTYLDRDDLMEQGICEEDAADRVLEEKIGRIREKVIVDAQVPWREKREGELYFLVFPPLEKLLERDAQRTHLLKRTEKRAFYAREFVEKTHRILESIEKKHFDACFDSSKLAVKDEIDLIKSFLEKLSF